MFFAAPFAALAALLPLTLASLQQQRRQAFDICPDVFEVKVPHLDPEDAVWDHQRNLLYQSNLYRAKISVSDTKVGHKFDVHIPGVSSDAATTPFELAGLSLNKRDEPTRIYGVAKDHSAFTFTHQSKRGPNRFVSFPLPLSPSSKPDINIDLNPVQAAFEKQHGTWPFAPVDSTQDLAGNSYIVFALGAPAIAKVTPQGVASTFSFEAPKDIIPNRPGYTGIASIADKLVAYGGPRVLTAFDLKSSTPSKPVPVNIKGPPIKWTHAEKINAVASQDGSGDRLIVTNAPYVYSFRSTDNWQTATYKQFYRDEFRNNSLTTVTDLVFGDEAKGTLQRCIYGAGAYFGKGKFQSRTSWPLYKISSKLLMD